MPSPNKTPILQFYTFVVPCSSRTCEEISLGYASSDSTVSQYGCTVLCGLVPHCGSTVVWWLSRKLHWFGASLPITWWNPTLDKYKASYPADRNKLSLILRPTIVKIGPPSRRFLVIWYQSIHCHGRSRHNPHIYLWFTHHILLFCSSPKVH